MMRFREVQPLRENRASWLALPLLLPAAGWSVWLVTAEGVQLVPALVGLVLLGIVAVLAWGELRTEVHDDGLRVQFFLLTPRRHFPWAEIASAEARHYRPIREYGGWGLRFGPSGSAWNVRGDRGVQLVFRSGRRLLIGSQRAEELALAIEAARSQVRTG